MFGPLVILRNMNSNRKSVENELPKYKVRQYSNKLLDFLIWEAPLHNDLLAPACMNYLPTLPDFYPHVGIDELATTSTLFLLEVSQWIMKETVWSSRNNWKAASVLLKMATVGNAYHTLLQQVKPCDHRSRTREHIWKHVKACKRVWIHVNINENMWKHAENRVQLSKAWKLLTIHENILVQSVTNVFEYSNIFDTNIYSDIRLYQFL